MHPCLLLCLGRHKGFSDAMWEGWLFLRYIDQYQHPTKLCRNEVETRPGFEPVDWTRRTAGHYSQGRSGHKGILDAIQGRHLFLLYIDQHQHPTSTVWKSTKAMQNWSWNKTWDRTCDLDQGNHEPWLPRAKWTQKYIGRAIKNLSFLRYIDLFLFFYFQPTTESNFLKMVHFSKRFNIVLSICFYGFYQ